MWWWCLFSSQQGKIKSVKNVYCPESAAGLNCIYVNRRFPKQQCAPASIQDGERSCVYLFRLTRQQITCSSPLRWKKTWHWPPWEDRCCHQRINITWMMPCAHRWETCFGLTLALLLSGTFSVSAGKQNICIKLNTCEQDWWGVSGQKHFWRLNYYFLNCSTSLGDREVKGMGSPRVHT